jgi:hypothetical protein
MCHRIEIFNSPISQNKLVGKAYAVLKLKVKPRMFMLYWLGSKGWRTCARKKVDNEKSWMVPEGYSPVWVSGFNCQRLQFRASRNA